MKDQTFGSVVAQSDIAVRSTIEDGALSENSTSTESSNMSNYPNLLTPATVAFPQVHRLRLEQAKTMNIDYLTPVQWGLLDVDKCHHISTTITSRESPPSYRVRVCKTCCKQDNHIELGTYVDQESAVLINDVHEILQERYDKLIVLTKEDKPFLHLLQVRYYECPGCKFFNLFLV